MIDWGKDRRIDGGNVRRIDGWMKGKEGRREGEQGKNIRQTAGQNQPPDMLVRQFVALF